MWEDTAGQPQATQPEPQGEPTPKPAAPRAAGGNVLLWVQIILCVLIAAGVWAAHTLGLPLYAQLRADYARALSLPSPEFWGRDGAQNLVRFTQETFAELRGALRQAAGTPATAETSARAGTPHGRSLLTSADAYLPGFTLVYPLPGARAAQTSAYGTRTDPITGQENAFHTGIDLSAAEGTPVLAAASGVVRAACAHKSYGNYVRILHPGGDETIYAHLQYLFVRPGQQVAQGQQLGTSGQTGDATGPHLHFELLHQGVRYDPTKALSRAEPAA